MQMVKRVALSKYVLIVPSLDDSKEKNNEHKEAQLGSLSQPTAMETEVHPSVEKIPMMSARTSPWAYDHLERLKITMRILKGDLVAMCMTQIANHLEVIARMSYYHIEMMAQLHRVSCTTSTTSISNSTGRWHWCLRCPAHRFFYLFTILVWFSFVRLVHSEKGLPFESYHTIFLSLLVSSLCFILLSL